MPISSRVFFLKRMRRRSCCVILTQRCFRILAPVLIRKKEMRLIDVGCKRGDVIGISRGKVGDSLDFFCVESAKS